MFQMFIQLPEDPLSEMVVYARIPSQYVDLI